MSGTDAWTCYPTCARVRYEEWQTTKEETEGCISIALFSFSDAADEGVEWRHLHETWLDA